MEDPYSNFLSLHPSADCKDVDARPYIEVFNGIGGNEIYLLSENRVVEKPYEKL